MTAGIWTTAAATTGASATQHGGVALRAGPECLELVGAWEQCDEGAGEWHEPPGVAAMMHERRAPNWDAIPPTRQ